MASARGVALATLLKYGRAVQQIDTISVHPGTPQGYTATQSQLLHTRVAVSPNPERRNPSYGKVPAKCKICGVTFYSFKSRIESGKTCCSRKCADNSKKIHGLQKSRTGGCRDCEECGGSFYLQKNELSKKKYCSKKCYSAALKKRTGPLAAAWGGGKQPDEDLRDGAKAKAWRLLVFERDNWTCQHCGKRGGNLEAHHLKPFSVFKEIRFEISNGLTLCEPCHRKTDSYGSKARKWKQQEVLP